MRSSSSHNLNFHILFNKTQPRWTKTIWNSSTNGMDEYNWLDYLDNMSFCCGYCDDTQTSQSFRRHIQRLWLQNSYNYDHSSYFNIHCDILLDNEYLLILVIILELINSTPSDLQRDLLLNWFYYPYADSAVCINFWLHPTQ